MSPVSHGPIAAVALCSIGLVRPTAAADVVSVPPPKLSTTPRHGACGITKELGSCTTGETGFWSLPDAAVKNWTVAGTACLRLCARCARCRFVSISWRARLCSWYATCDAVSTEGQGLTSVTIPGNVPANVLLPYAKRFWQRKTRNSTRHVLNHRPSPMTPKRVDKSLEKGPSCAVTGSFETRLQCCSVGWVEHGDVWLRRCLALATTEQHTHEHEHALIRAAAGLRA